MKDRGALDRLEKKLGKGSEEGRRSRLGGSGGSAPHGWAPPTPPRVRKGKPLRGIDMLFLGSLAFFIIAGAAAFFLFSSGTNTVSTRNVAIVLDGPTSIGAGDTLSLTVSITNKNSVPMQLTDLVIEFPPGTRSEADVSVDLPRIRESLGTINPGESVNRQVRAVIFGTAGQNVSVGVSVEYRVPASNAIFTSEGSYTIPLTSSPASITVDAVSDVVSGEATAFAVTVSSNAPDVLSNMVLIAQYPPGFSFISSTPAPAFGSTSWKLGDIEEGGKRTVTIRGRFSGEDGDARVVKFAAGAGSPANDGTITAPLASSETNFMLAKPSIGASLTIDGDPAPQHVIPRGKSVRVDVRWTNNLPERVENLIIAVKLDGSILDRTSVVPQKGFFRSSDNTVVFGPESDSSFNDVPAGASGVVSLTFSTLTTGTFRNPELIVTASAGARSPSGGPVTSTGSSAHLTVATDLGLTASLSHGSGDTGPVPPKADQETVYTVTWIAQNSANAVANAVVSATLPSYARFVGPVGNAGVTYNAVGGVVTWAVGDMAEGAATTASFKIAVTPSLSQVGSAPTVISGQRFAAFDRFTRTNVETTAQPLTTGSGVSQQQGLVVP